MDWKNTGNLNSNGEIVWDKIDEALSMGAKEHMENSKTDFEKANVVFTTRMIKMAYNSCQEEQIEGDTPGQKDTPRETGKRRRVINQSSENMPNIVKDEIENTLKKMKNGKAPGEDGIVI
ncbi:hypothetical protein ILUMI_14873 [Ignelater luminosus]|uniref:Uncharacterized protein n=1 Tax=Ignelater luminosus TaxID=2038154 RepID=A0A8K0G4F4_IGNLU|nr:hypothetical protein ILUMI_14873 [Ignelater luminosus]